MITRTVHKVVAHAVKIERVEGKIITTVLEGELYFPRKPKEKDLEVAFQSHFKNQFPGYCKFTMESYDFHEEVRGISFETFLEFSTPVTRPASQQKEEVN